MSTGSGAPVPLLPQISLCVVSIGSGAPVPLLPQISLHVCVLCLQALVLQYLYSLRSVYMSVCCVYRLRCSSTSTPSDQSTCLYVVSIGSGAPVPLLSQISLHVCVVSIGSGAPVPLLPQISLHVSVLCLQAPVLQYLYSLRSVYMSVCCVYRLRCSSTSTPSDQSTCLCVVSIGSGAPVPLLPRPDRNRDVAAQQ